MGYGVVRKEGSKTTYVESGILPVVSSEIKGRQLLSLYGRLEELLDRIKPDFVGIEGLFFTTNRKTALEVAEARGVILLAITEVGLFYSEFTPTEAKSLLTGDGKASKDVVAKIVRLHLGGEPRGKKIDDELDALAIALITAQTSTIGQKLKIKNQSFGMPTA